MLRPFGSLYPRPVIEPQFMSQRLQNRRRRLQNCGRVGDRAAVLRTLFRAGRM
jgi:hypothetical protein